MKIYFIEIIITALKKLMEVPQVPAVQKFMSVARKAIEMSFPKDPSKDAAQYRAELNTKIGYFSFFHTLLSSHFITLAHSS